MVHIAAGYARARNRLGTFACTTSVGPGATNMVTGAALATINRLPVLLLPGDTFATRTPHPVLQMLEAPGDATVSVNDCFRPVSRFYERVERAEQLIPAALEAMRVLSDPAQTGAVTLALPEDVQAEAFEVPGAFLEPRVWTIYRQPPAPEALARAAELIRAAKRAADRGRRRGDLQRGGPGAARVRRRHRDPGGRDDGRARGIGVRPSAQSGSVGGHRRERGQPAGARRRPGDRDRHAVERFHDRVAFGLPGPWRAVRQRQRGRVRRGQTERAAGAGRRRGSRSSSCRPGSPAGGSTPIGRRGRRKRRRRGGTRWPASARSRSMGITVASQPRLK